jgi:hypothetical protein
MSLENITFFESISINSMYVQNLLRMTAAADGRNVLTFTVEGNENKPPLPLIYIEIAKSNLLFEDNLFESSLK